MDADVFHPTAASAFVELFLHGLRQHGRVEGQHFVKEMWAPWSIAIKTE